MPICLYRWSHPAGFHGLGTFLAEAMPVDACMTAFFTCLGAMRRMDARGWSPHVPPEAFHRGPLALLFPRGTSASFYYSLLASRRHHCMGLPVGRLFCLGLLTAFWAPHFMPQRLDLCRRAERMVDDGGAARLDRLLLYGALHRPTTSPPARSSSARKLRREADDKQRRTAAAFFGVYQTVNIIVALIVVVLARRLLIFGDGAIPPQVWISALVIAGIASSSPPSASVSTDTIGATRYMQQRRCGRARCSACTLLCLSRRTRLASRADHLILRPRDNGLHIRELVVGRARCHSRSRCNSAQKAANSMSHLAIGSIVLCAVQSLGLVNVCSLLSSAARVPSCRLRCIRRP